MTHIPATLDNLLIDENGFFAATAVPAAGQHPAMVNLTVYDAHTLLAPDGQTLVYPLHLHEARDLVRRLTALIDAAQESR
ncbi:hypothetical protein [Frankia sp. AgB32]|uniref:hypothetical protein n=1 Tax=Frankia sp. AgB32 TaxID=631119 RepID=UPI00200C805E|nr:hypothetical protein [Frankia sp. AgB32]MCK9895226.1 hypothetical protein [Frankia sp. AgB32]